MRWGLIPHWAKDASIGSRMINARAETVAEKPVFRDTLRRRRCLVLADGFYEWQRAGGLKRPMRIVMRSAEPFAFAGLWSVWRNPDGNRISSCAIITTAANELLWDGLPPAVTNALGQPIDPALVSQHKGRGGRVFDYLEGHAVIDQANRIFGCAPRHAA